MSWSQARLDRVRPFGGISLRHPESRQPEDVAQRTTTVSPGSRIKLSFGFLPEMMFWYDTSNTFSPDAVLRKMTIFFFPPNGVIPPAMAMACSRLTWDFGATGPG